MWLDDNSKNLRRDRELKRSGTKLWKTPTVRIITKENEPDVGKEEKSVV